MTRYWHDDHDLLVQVWHYAKGEYLIDVDEAEDFFVAPWGYDHLHDAWRVASNAEAAEDQRTDARMEAGAL